MSLYKDASLVMIPSAYKDGKLYSIRPTDGSGDFTFSRGSNLAATRVDVNGLIEKGRENLLLQSNNFGTTWAKSSATIASGQSGYDGSNNAWNFTTSAAGASLEQSVTTAGVVVVSLYAKANGINGVRLRIDAATDANGYFNLSTGAVHSFAGSAINASITSVGGGWYRCEVAANISSPVKVAIYTTDGTTSYDNGSILIQDSQYEQGLVATDYIETGASTAQAGILEDMPRLDYSGGASCPSLLLEPQRTNLIPHSEYFGGWTNDTNTTLTENAAQSPSGFVDAYKLVAGTSAARQARTLSVAADGNLVFSIYAKKGEYSVVQLTDAVDGNLYANFDLENGVLGNYDRCTPSIEDAGDGWYRCIITWTASANINKVRISIAESKTQGRLVNFAGNGTDGIYIYGAQLEAGSYPTSYIPTYGTSQTRSNDSCAATSVSDVIGQTDGTMFFDVNISRVVGNEAIGTINSGGYANHATIQRIGNTIQFVRNSATQSGATIVTSATITAGRYKLAIAYKSGDTACFLNGAQVSTTQTQTFTNATLNAVKIGTDAIGALPISDSINQALLFKTRLTNAELAALTTI